MKTSSDIESILNPDPVSFYLHSHRWGNFNPYDSAVLWWGPTNEILVEKNGGSFSPSTGYYQGTFDVVVPWNETVGGYAWQIWARTAAYSEGRSSVSADFSNTINISQFQLADGTILTDRDVTFDSGRTISSTVSTVPEPTSMALFGLGSLSMGVMVRRRKRRIHGNRAA